MSKSNISNQVDGDYRMRTDESGDVSLALVPAVSCWEAWRWELTRAALRGSCTSFMTLDEDQVIQPKSRQER
jgi:hypothetical protein